MDNRFNKNIAMKHRAKIRLPLSITEPYSVITKTFSSTVVDFNVPKIIENWLMNNCKNHYDYELNRGNTETFSGNCI